jgi:hypothetical protein
MKRFLVLSALALIGLGAEAQQVWKCPVGDQIRYSDKPCPQSGQPLPERQLQPNIVEPVRAPAASDPFGSAPAAASSAERRRNVCPSDAELRSMETRASSITFGPDEKLFLQDEIRRALQCIKGQGHYTASDWDISRRAQEAQSSLSGARDARLRAEAMHSAADPDEGDRIARRRQQEDSDRRRAEALERATLQRGQNRPAPVASAPR